MSDYLLTFDDGTQETILAPNREVARRQGDAIDSRRVRSVQPVGQNEFPGVEIEPKPIESLTLSVEPAVPSADKAADIRKPVPSRDLSHFPERHRKPVKRKRKARVRSPKRKVEVRLEARQLPRTELRDVEEIIFVNDTGRWSFRPIRYPSREKELV